MNSETLPIFSPKDYQPDYITYCRETIIKARRLRAEYRQILSQRLEHKYGHPLLSETFLSLSDIQEIAFLLSSSRGGSSVTMDLLRQQARTASNEQRRVLSIPGEERPHLVLAGLYSPFIETLADELDGKHVWQQDPFNKTQFRADTLKSEIMSEIGYPIKETNDLITFAIRIYGRLLLQWPNINFGEAQEAIEKILSVVRGISIMSSQGLVYADNQETRKKMMLGIQQLFPEINLLFYDGFYEDEEILQRSSEDYNPLQYTLEETPFIIPSPWHYASNNELDNGILLLKDPSNAWRIDFLKELFRKSTIHWLHLTRDPRESINGLCDGWKFRGGYLTTMSPKPVSITGYTDHLLQSQYVNYSTPHILWVALSQGNEIALEHLAALQWAEAHRAIMEGVSGDPKYYKIANDEYPIGFDWMRDDTEGAVRAICEHLGIPATLSLLQAAFNMSKNVIQATPGTDPRIRDRWKQAENHELVERYAALPFVASIAALLEIPDYLTENDN